MKIFSKLLFFAMLLAAVSCSNVGSNNETATTNSKPASNEGSSVEEKSNKEAGAKSENDSASVNSDTSKGANISPDELVERLYEQNDNENSPFFQDDKRELVDRFFVKNLADMIWKDSVESKDEVGALDFDPLFNAQDTEVAEFKVSKPEIKGDKAVVNVNFLNFGEQQDIKYLLAKENGAWKIEDIDYGEFTLVKLYKENAK